MHFPLDMAQPFGYSPDSSNTGESSRHRIKKYLVLFLTLLLLVGGGFFGLSRLGILKHAAGPTQAAPIQVQAGTDVSQTTTRRTPDSTPDTVQHDTQSSDATSASYQSEHFRVGSIALGGESELLVPENNPTPLEIGSVRGEAFTEKGKNTSKLVITWETNKPAKSEISYGKGVGVVEGTVTEDAYGLTHSVILPDLNQSSTYVYTIVAHDQFGQNAESDPYAVYTGAREVSLFELMAGAIGEVFGWAVDK